MYNVGFGNSLLVHYCATIKTFLNQTPCMVSIQIDIVPGMCSYMCVSPSVSMSVFVCPP